MAFRHSNRDGSRWCFPERRPGFYIRAIRAFPRTLAPAGNLDFAPRIGVAYSPDQARDTLLGKIFGGPGNTSIRAGFGVYYESIEALSIGILAANAPFGITYSSPPRRFLPPRS